MNPFSACVVATTVSIALLAPAAFAAPRRYVLQEKSVDLIKATRAEISAFKTMALSADDVGDPDSFGRNVKYLGLAQSSVISILPDCTPDPAFPPEPNDRCLTLPAQPNTTVINESGLATMSLPAKATHSLMCFALTPLATFQFMNNTGIAQGSASFNILTTITIQNEVLNDSSLIDPTTGVPFNGELTLSLSTYSESRSLAINERAQKGLRFSRHCIAGIIGKRALVEAYGLTDAQANAFFQKPMKLSFGATGSVRLVDFASYLYGVRLYGD